MVKNVLADTTVEILKELIRSGKYTQATIVVLISDMDQLYAAICDGLGSGAAKAER